MKGFFSLLDKMPKFVSPKKNSQKDLECRWFIWVEIQRHRNEEPRKVSSKSRKNPM